MSDYQMTDERRRVLAEFEGKCAGCNLAYMDHCFYLCLYDPMYTTDVDMLRVFRKMTPGEFHSFCNGTWHIWCDSHRNRVLYHSDFHRWLIDNPERALCLAADWVERGRGNEHID